MIRRLSHIDVIVGVHRRLASEWCARELTAAVGDHLVHVHVELGAAAGHPHMQREHVVMLASEDFVASLNDQLVLLIFEPLAGMICRGSSLLQDGIGRDHLTRNQIFADAEMLKRALCLGPPELVGGDSDLAEAIGFRANVTHRISPNLSGCVAMPYVAATVP